jgi:hypothetical protein
VVIRSELNGDYFKSDLAHQIQENIRATADLFKKSERAKGQPTRLWQPRGARHRALAWQKS